VSENVFLHKKEIYQEHESALKKCFPMVSLSFSSAPANSEVMQHAHPSCPAGCSSWKIHHALKYFRIFQDFFADRRLTFFLLRKNQASVISVTILIEFAGGPIICKKKYNNKNV